MRPARGQWIAAWPGASLIGIVNGALREAVLAKGLDEQRANQASGVTLALALCLYFRALQRRWPLSDAKEALSVGAAWTALTVAFEFGFGRLVAKDSWDELLAAYDVRNGELWPLVLAWIAVGPEVLRRAQRSV
jgi:hypothetical protein